METGNIVPTDYPLAQQPVMDPLCKELSEVLVDNGTNYSGEVFVDPDVTISTGHRKSHHIGQ
jgi:hypothetical protein